MCEANRLGLREDAATLIRSVTFKMRNRAAIVGVQITVQAASAAL